MPSLTRHDGEIEIDQRATGLPIPGFGGMHYLGPTLGCVHCGGVVVLNPQRTRAREYCRHCDRYICDGCYEVSKLAGYQHRTINELTEMVQSGRYVVAGGTVCNPIVVPTGVIPDVETNFSG